MKTEKKLAVLQIDSILGDVDANLEKISSMIHSIEDKEVRMAVFCEYGTTGYSLDLNSVAEEIFQPRKPTLISRLLLDGSDIPE